MKLTTAHLREVEPLLAEFPRLTRFYGLPPRALVKMPNSLLALYIEQIPVLEAAEQLAALQAADYPHITEKDRARIHKDLMRDAEFEYASEKLDAKKDTAALRGIGIKVTIEPPKPKPETPDA